uniref:Small ribosomal subunit protein eS4 C-terminal domain-containing protein n=1 Tax=Timema genevievae TaxID=629358 RepID=A0A7R9PQ34_TIMGE|nr:unnamed protein product [Timema genevievae]
MVRGEGRVNLDFVHLNRLNNVFIIGKVTKPYVSLPRGKGVKLSIAEERDKRLAAKAASS